MRFIRSLPLQHIAVALLLVRTNASAQTPPSQAEQQRALAEVTGFAHGYMDRLPNFMCLRTTRHLAGKLTARTPPILAPEATTEHELSYYDHDEHYRLIAVDGVPAKTLPKRIKSEAWMEMSGNFGWILTQIFDPKVHPHFEWYGWDEVRGRKAMVFSYRIARPESRAVSTACSSWLVFTRCKDNNYGFQGRFFLDAESFDVLRITDMPDSNLPSFFQGTTSIEYARVQVAGSEYLLPVADSVETTGGAVMFRNDSTYTDYRNFGSESTLKTDTVTVIP